ncbi:MAG: MucR family transcriptional regulator, partial [Desulfosalsimonadaceae bacterium]
MFTTKAQIDDYYAGEFIYCLICGAPKLRTLGSHLYRKHKGVSVDDYKIMFGLPHSRGVCSDVTSKRNADALLRRKDLGDRSMILTPETRWKGQHAPKYQPPIFAKKRLRENGRKAVEELKKRSLCRISDIDWEKFLQTVQETGKGINSLCHQEGMPSAYDVQRKKRIDKKFEREYGDAKKK